MEPIILPAIKAHTKAVDNCRLAIMKLVALLTRLEVIIPKAAAKSTMKIVTAITRICVGVWQAPS
ncbi:MAG: hypothetical protein QXP20_03345 [Candidatus Bathyarchaeia archaeon]